MGVHCRRGHIGWNRWIAVVLCNQQGVSRRERPSHSGSVAHAGWYPLLNSGVGQPMRLEVKPMHRVTTPDGTVVSYDKYGSGPPLVLVHGGFSDHKTNWEFVKPIFEKQYTTY